MDNHAYIDVHIIQTVPPSNLNRDDAGAPKQAIYGGVRRARVSSQAWKRATRKAFQGWQAHAEEAVRTQRIAELVADGVAAKADGVDRDTVEKVVAAVLKPLKVSPGKREAETAYLLFVGRRQIQRIAELIAERLPELWALEGKDLDEVAAEIPAAAELSNGHPLDVALFGRMVADLPAINVDASVQVAHALSTHAVETEFDYFTAVDDAKDRERGDDAGAGMIGTVEFNSATLYRYATVGLHQLADNLGGSLEDAVAGVQRFVEGFARSIPSGHQTSFAHQTLPEAVVIVVRDDQPVNLVAAFEKPVRAHGDGYASDSMRCLAEKLVEAEQLWGAPPRRVLSLYPNSVKGDVEEAFGPAMPFSEIVGELGVVLSSKGE